MTRLEMAIIILSTLIIITSTFMVSSIKSKIVQQDKHIETMTQEIADLNQRLTKEQQTIKEINFLMLVRSGQLEEVYTVVTNKPME